MYCTKCQTDLSDCTCEDIKERLASLKSSPNLLMKWCSQCDNHYSQCKCDNPVWTTSMESFERNEQRPKKQIITNIRNHGK